MDGGRDAIRMTARCKAITKMVWWRKEPTPCKLPAWKDGFCRKHHPARRAERGDVSKELGMCRETLKQAEQRVERAKQKLVELETEQRAWNAFMGGGGGFSSSTPSSAEKQPNGALNGEGEAR